MRLLTIGGAVEKSFCLYLIVYLHEHEDGIDVISANGGSSPPIKDAMIEEEKKNTRFGFLNIQKKVSLKF